jgi:acyl-CoA synthetase (AMP-forming)/AMP-acid ligase II/acyl carrier protein
MHPKNAEYHHSGARGCPFAEGHGALHAPLLETLSMNTSWVKLLRDRASRSGDQHAYAFMSGDDKLESTLTYGQLDRQARAIAHRLLDANIAGGRALLLYPPGLEFIAGLFGCWYAGVTAVPAYPPRSAQHASSLATLDAIARDSEPAIVLTAARLRATLEPAAASVATIKTTPILSTDDLSEDSANSWREPQQAGKSLACLQYTSGSTGSPKGVMLSHANLLSNSQLISECFEHNADSRGVIWLPPYHDMGLIGGVLQPLYVGFPVTLMAPAAFLQRPMRWLSAISRFRGTTSGGPNFAYELCCKQARPEELAGLDLSSWTVAFNGAEPIDPGTIDRFCEVFGPCGFLREAFYPCYGLAESTLIVTGGERSAAPVIHKAKMASLEANATESTITESAEKSFIGCGRARNGGSVDIIDPATRAACAPGKAGEIWVRGTSVALGYWNKPQETAETFAATRADTGEGPYLRTGDLGFLENGELFITGRLKDLIIIRGLNHYPQDIELTAQTSHPALRPAGGAAFSVTSGPSEQLVIVHEVERTSRNADPDTIIAAIRQAVAQRHDLQVSAIVLLTPGRLPKTSSGKTRRSACRAAYLSNTLEPLAQWTLPVEVPVEIPVKASEESQEAPSFMTAEAIENLIVEKVAAALNVSSDEIDPAEPFARYGLDSVGAVGLAGDLEAALGRELPGTLFYDYPSARDLSRHLAGLPPVPTTSAAA